MAGCRDGRLPTGALRYAEAVIAARVPVIDDSAAARRAAEAQRRADALAVKADRMEQAASGMYGRFAGGQPLLVGHHSYRSALRDRNRADNTTRRAIEAREGAKRAQGKANKAAAVAALETVEATRSRAWERSDFRPGDVVEVRDFPP
jgi:hypothetical protein